MEDAIEQWRHAHGEVSYLTFLKLADFIREAAEKTNIPELEGLATSSSPRFNRNSKPKPDNEKGSSLSTSAKSDGNGKSDPTNSSKSKDPGPNGLAKCLFYRAKHKLDDCTVFCRKPFSERRDFFFPERLCMSLDTYRFLLISTGKCS